MMRSALIPISAFRDDAPEAVRAAVTFGRPMAETSATEVPAT